MNSTPMRHPKTAMVANPQGYNEVRGWPCSGLVNQRLTFKFQSPECHLSNSSSFGCAWPVVLVVQAHKLELETLHPHIVIADSFWSCLVLGVHVSLQLFSNLWPPLWDFCYSWPLGSHPHIVNMCSYRERRNFFKNFIHTRIRCRIRQ